MEGRLLVNDPLVLVTGANGFVGSHLVRHLLKEGFRVRGLVRSTSDLAALEGLSVERAYGDIHDPDSLPAVLQGVSILFHVAGLTKSRDPRHYFEVNQVGTIHLATAALQVPSLKRFVYLSSQAAVGPSRADRPRAEYDTPAPTGGVRAKQTRRRRSMSPGAGGSTPADHYPTGGGLWPLGTRHAATVQGGQATTGPPPVGDSCLSLIHAADLADLVTRAARHREAAGCIYHAADPSPYWMRQVLATMGRVLHRRARQIPIPVPILWPAALINEQLLKRGKGIEALTRTRIREFGERHWVLDVRRAQSDLAWTPQITLEEGLRDTARWYLSHGWL
jgi:2-alkyl-3-oxoalkanoate reductase